MGEYGCGWVSMDDLGCRGHGGTRKQDKKGTFGAYKVGHDRGNFPGHDVLWFFPKMVKNGFGWVRVDAYGCNGGYAHGGKQKQGKINLEMLGRDMFSHARLRTEINKNSETNNFGVERGTHACKWAQMDLDMCDGVQGCGGTQK